MSRSRKRLVCPRGKVLLNDFVGSAFCRSLLEKRDYRLPEPTRIGMNSRRRGSRRNSPPQINTPHVGGDCATDITIAFTTASGFIRFIIPSMSKNNTGSAVMMRPAQRIAFETGAASPGEILLITLI